jgi:ABC-type glycerol-3-phosphate transport system substrate-binding protein
MVSLERVMIRKQWGFALASAATAAILVAGCGSSAPSASGPAASAPGASAPGASASAASAPAAAGSVHLAYWDFLDPSQDNPRSKALKTNLANFQTANPDIAVDLSVVSLGDMLTRLPQAAAAGQAPDVFKMFTPVVSQMAAAGAYSPLPAAASGITDWLRPITNLAGPDGQQVAVPYEYRTCTFYYNQKILSKLGVAVPTTYDEVVDVAKKAAAAGYTGFGTGFSNTDNSAVIGTFFECFMSQVGQDIWDANGQAAFATPKGEEFGNFLAKLKAAGGFGPNVVSDTYGSVVTGLTNGTVAMAVLGTERIVTFAATNPDIKWGPLPLASTGDHNGSVFGWTLGIGAGSKNVDAAWKFIEYMTGPAAGAVMATGGEVPTRAATYKDPYFATAAAATINSISDYVQKYSTPHHYANNYNAVSSALAAAGQALVLNNTSGSQFIQSAQQAANK